MSPTELKEAAAVMLAKAENPELEIEYRWRDANTWIPIDYPGWEWGRCEYRLAPTPPAPTVNPWTFADAPLTLKVRRKSDGALFRMEARPRGALLFDDGIPDEVAYLVLRTDFEQLDSQPCGVVEGGAK